ncbi:MAG: Stf0 family sulfotransferase [Verrucomicrobiota bacterium]
MFHRWRHPTRCYAICAVARSGSNLLSDGLRATGKAGRPKQFFCEKLESGYGEKHGFDPVRDYAGYVRGIVESTASRNGVFGFRLMGWDLQPFVRRLSQTGEFGEPEASDLEVLQTAFSRLQFVHICRRDRLRQAISKTRALQTDLWKIGNGKSAIAEAKFDPELISHSIKDVIREEEIWSDFFTGNGIEPFRVAYEDLAKDYHGVVEAVLNFLHIRLPRGTAVGDPTTIRQSDATSDEWQTRYRALAAERSDLLPYV